MSAVYPPRIRQSEWSIRSVNIDSGATETSISYHRTRRGRDGHGSHVCPALPISSLPVGGPLVAVKGACYFGGESVWTDTGFRHWWVWSERKGTLLCPLSAGVKGRMTITFLQHAASAVFCVQTAGQTLPFLVDCYWSTQRRRSTLILLQAKKLRIQAHVTT